MADQIEDQTEISVVDLADLLLIVDVSDTTDDAGGTTKKGTLQRILATNHGINDFRLSLEQNVPLSSTDQDAKTTIWCNPCCGNKMGLYDGTRWGILGGSAFSVAVPSTIFRLFDVFAYNNSGALALETTDWNQTTGTITAATGSGVEVQVTSNSHGLTNGEIVGITGMGGNTNPNGGIWRVGSVATNTFNLQACIGNATYTSGGTWYKLNSTTRATALAYQDGVLVKSGTATRRYLGTGMTMGVSGQCRITTRWCQLWNFYNQFKMNVEVADTGSHTLNNVATIREWNTYTAGVAGKARCGAVIADVGMSVVCQMYARKSSTNTANMILDPLFNAAPKGAFFQIHNTAGLISSAGGFHTKAALGFNTLSIGEREFFPADAAPDYGYTFIDFMG